MNNKEYKIKRSAKWLIHAIATCKECDWYDDDYTTASKTGGKHTVHFGHEVSLETGYAERIERAHL